MHVDGGFRCATDVPVRAPEASRVGAHERAHFPSSYLLNGSQIPFRAPPLHRPKNLIGGRALGESNFRKEKSRRRVRSELDVVGSRRPRGPARRGLARSLPRTPVSTSFEEAVLFQAVDVFISPADNTCRRQLPASKSRLLPRRSLEVLFCILLQTLLTCVCAFGCL